MSIHVCDQCGKPIPDDATVCPHCGATQVEDIRLTKIPETIEELQAFCAMHKMPLDAMRFFIGEDFKGAKAFGIYKDANGDCVVYKNKADGSRAVRYKGPDEKHAVREIYEKLKSETDLRRGVTGKRAPERTTVSERREDDNTPLKPWALFIGAILWFWKPIIAIVIVTFCIHLFSGMPDNGYYRYQDNTYYYQNSDWYYFNALTNDWERTYDVPQELEKSYDDYYDGETYDNASAVTDFSDSSYYESEQSYSSDSTYDDYDWDWGSGDDDNDSWSSWDSSDTDWDSDW